MATERERERERKKGSGGREMRGKVERELRPGTTNATARRLCANSNARGASSTTSAQARQRHRPSFFDTRRRGEEKRQKKRELFKVCATSLNPAASSMMLKTYDINELNQAEKESISTRPRIDFESIQAIVGPIVDDVKERGDQAVKDLTAKFDKCELDETCVRLEDVPWPEGIPKSVTDAFDVAYENVKVFHEAQMQAELKVETMPGVTCRRVSRAIGAVGLYVPGGTAVLPSTALMLAVPAKVAGSKTIVLATPPRKDASISPEVLYCAKKAGVTHLLKAGGAQAVAAMAHGTETCPKVDKIAGPGNQFVTAAKMMLQNSEAMVGIDMPAGPSEVLVIADKGAEPAHVAADLLSQAEHGADSQSVLVAMKGVNMEEVQEEVRKQCDALPRYEMAVKALSHSFVVQVDTLEQACDFSNIYAPEHLIVNVEDAERCLDMVENAGSVFLGRWTPESVGDYASGTNHTLPTYGYARMYSGVSLDTFQKKITVQSLSKEGLLNLGPAVEIMAEVEGLEAHKQAVTLRLRSIKS